MKNFALIGAGSMARNYLNTFEQNNKAKISSIFSKTNINLKKIKGKYFKTTNINDILNSKLDGVIIVTPASTHFELASIFLKKGLNVLIEKPLTTSLNDALKLKKINSHGRVMVGHTLLFHPSYQALKKLLKNKQILSISFEGYNNSPRPDTSLIWDWGPHPASIFLDLIPEFPKKINRVKYSKSEIILSLEYKNNIKATISIGWNSKIKKRKVSVKTTDKEYIFDDMASSKLEIHSNSGNTITFEKHQDTKPLDLEVAEFLKAVKGHSYISDLNFGISTIKFLDLCLK